MSEESRLVGAGALFSNHADHGSDLHANEQSGPEHPPTARVRGHRPDEESKSCQGHNHEPT